MIDLSIVGISGMSSSQFIDAYFEYINYTDQPAGYSPAGQSYDMAWAVALALNNTAHVLKSRGKVLQFTSVNSTTYHTLFTYSILL